MKTKKLGYKEYHRIKNVGIEGSKGNIIVDERQAVKIRINYITDLCDQSKRPENQKSNFNTKEIQTINAPTFCKAKQR